MADILLISKNQIKKIQSLKLKKNRDQAKLFVAEGEKIILELLGHFTLHLLVTSDGDIKWVDKERTPLVMASDSQFKSISSLQTTRNLLAVFEQPSFVAQEQSIENELTLVLDRIQDPGNMGTIIRLADWFGIRQVVCSADCADIYNSKTVQATMGALARVRIWEEDLVSFLKKYSHLPLYGTFLEGENIYQSDLSSKGLIIMGNEGNGISFEVEQLVTHKLYIPPYPAQKQTVESLNVAVATSIVCSEFRRRIF